MTAKILGWLLVAVFACCLLNGCQRGFHLVLFNDTNDTVVLRPRNPERTPMIVDAEVAGEFTGVSTEDFTIERKSKLLHYHFPQAYTYPSSGLSKYTRKLQPLGRSFVFQLAPDNRIYVLRRHEVMNTRMPDAQPAGFPLVPH